MMKMLWPVILSCLIAPGRMIAQDEPHAVQVHGSNVLDGLYSNRQGTHSQVPEKFLRNDFQMTVQTFDIPFATSFFITTEQEDYMQRINNFRFYIDLVTLKKNRARIEAENKAKKLEKVKAPWMIRFLSNFSKIEAGRFRPDYGDLTLKDISVSGLNLELTNKVVYAAFATGTVKRPTPEEKNFAETYKQKLLFGKFGFGEKRTSHFYLTYMHIEDETSQPIYNPIDYTVTLKAQSNVVIGAEMRLSFLKNKWTIDGDAGISALTRDTRISIPYDSIIVDSIFRRVPDFLIDAVQPNISTAGDYAYGFSSKLNLKTTTITAAYRWVGPGYFTLGNPMLVNDRQTIEGRIDQAMLKRKLSVAAYYKRFEDNLIDWKQGTTISNAYGVIVKLTLQKAPYFQVSYTPNNQETSGKNISIRNRMNILSISSGYKYRVESLMLFTSLNFLNQNADYERDTLKNESKTLTLTLNQSIEFAVPLLLNFSAGYSNINNASAEKNVVSFVLSGTHNFKKKWKNTLGGKLMNSGGEPGEQKYSLFWYSMVNFWKDWEIGLNIDENIFRSDDPASEDYNELIVQCKLSLKW